MKGYPLCKVNSQAMKWAALFPGQGSQKPGMGRDLYENFAIAKNIFERASEATGLDITNICFELSEDDLRRTDRAQIALFTCGVAAYSAFSEICGQEASVGAGHSVGEYAALVCAGALSIEEGARLIARRGELMDGAPKGAMSAVLGLDKDALQATLDSIEDVVVIANDNCPGQLVISGTPNGVALGGEKAQASGAKRVLPLNVSGAFHSPLMKDSAAQMSAALQKAEWQGQKFGVICNTEAKLINDKSHWADLLERQLASSVRWTESMEFLGKSGDCEIAFEFGGGEVLSGLMKRINKELPTIAVFDQASIASAKERIN